MLIRDLLLEGGNVFPNTGSIHRDEVAPTLAKLEQQTGLTGLKQNLLGTTGKKQFSGDIDIAIDWEPADLFRMLQSIYGADAVKKTGNTVHLNFPIQNYDPSRDQYDAQQQKRRRTGYTQVDFFSGDTDWNRTYYYSSANSKLPGKYRNLLLANVAIAQRQTTDHGDYIETVGYVFSPRDGLSLRKRIQKKNQAKKTEKIIKNIKNPTEIAQTLFGKSASANDLESAETVIAAIEKYLPHLADQIFANFEKDVSYDHRNLDWPESVSRHLNK
jgi:hypothetical protein